jgi:hypothetical protein
MAVIWQSRTYDVCTSSSDRTISVAVPTSTASGDLLIALCAVDGNDYFSPPGGWTALFIAASHLQAWYKVAGTESGNYDFTVGADSAYGDISVHRITGAGTPVGVNPVSGSTCPNVSVSLNDSLILWFATRGGSVMSITNGTERHNNETGASVRVVVNSEAIPTAGTVTGSATTTAEDCCAILVPPPSGPTIPVIMNYLRQMVN